MYLFMHSYYHEATHFIGVRVRLRVRVRERVRVRVLVTRQSSCMPTYMRHVSVLCMC